MSETLRKRTLARDLQEQSGNLCVNGKSFVKPSQCQLRPIFSGPRKTSDHNFSGVRAAKRQLVHRLFKMDH